MQRRLSMLCLVLCLTTSACADDRSSTPVEETATSEEAAPTPIAPSSRRKQRSDVEDFLDTYARDSVDAINAAKRSVSTTQFKTYYLDSKEIRELSAGSNGKFSYVAALRYCEVVNCHASTKSTEMVVMIPLKHGGYKLVKSIKLGEAGKINVLDDKSIEATTVTYGEGDPACCPATKTTVKYRLSGQALLEVD